MQPLVIDGARVRVDASAGVAEHDDPSVEIADLLRRADVAMYAAKDAHSRVELYQPKLDEANRTRLETIQDLDAALVHRQFVLHYQPKIDVETGAVFGAEALVRWEHPTRGLLYPDAFLPVVEQSGLMNAVTRLVLDVRRGAARRLARRPASTSASPSTSRPPTCSTSRSPSGSRGLLAEHAVPAGALELEITESVIMIDPKRAREVLEALRALGLRIAVDDYGTGYCALAYLRDLPIDELKIDRSFIAHVTTDRRSAAIVRSTIELAHALGLKVVAEGIEDQQALNALAAFGCDYAQGYHFSRPVPAEAFAAWVSARDRRAPSARPSARDRVRVSVDRPAQGQGEVEVALAEEASLRGLDPRDVLVGRLLVHLDDALVEERLEIRGLVAAGGRAPPRGRAPASRTPRIPSKPCTTAAS